MAITAAILPYSGNWDILYPNFSNIEVLTGASGYDREIFGFLFKPKDNRVPIEAISVYINDPGNVSIVIVPCQEFAVELDELYTSQKTNSIKRRYELSDTVYKDIIGDINLSVDDALAFVSTVASHPQVNFNFQTLDKIKDIIRFAKTYNQDKLLKREFEKGNRDFFKPEKFGLPITNSGIMIFMPNILEKHPPDYVPGKSYRLSTIRDEYHDFPDNIPQIHRAILDNDIAKVRNILFDEPYAVYKKCPFNWETYDLAADTGRLEILQFIVDCMDSICSCGKCNSCIVVIEFKLKIDIYKKDKFIFRHFEYSFDEIIQFVKKQYNSLAPLPVRHELFNLAFEGKTTAVINKIKEDGSLLNSIKEDKLKDPFGYTIMHIAIATNNIHLVRELLKLGVQIEVHTFHSSACGPANDYKYAFNMANMFREAKSVAMLQLILRNLPPIDKRVEKDIWDPNFNAIFSTLIAAITRAEHEVVDMILSYLRYPNTRAVSSPNNYEYFTAFEYCERLAKAFPTQSMFRTLAVIADHMKGFLKEIGIFGFPKPIQKIYNEHNYRFARSLVPAFTRPVFTKDPVNHIYLSHADLALTTLFQNPTNGTIYKSVLKSTADLTEHERAKLSSIFFGFSSPSADFDAKFPRQRFIDKTIESNNTKIKFLPYVELTYAHGEIIGAFSFAIAKGARHKALPKGFIPFCVLIGFVDPRHKIRPVVKLAYRFALALQVNNPKTPVIVVTTFLQPGLGFANFNKGIQFYPTQGQTWFPKDKYNIIAEHVYDLYQYLTDIVSPRKLEGCLIQANYLINIAPNFKNKDIRAFFRLLMSGSHFSRFSAMVSFYAYTLYNIRKEYQQLEKIGATPRHMKETCIKFPMFLAAQNNSKLSLDEPAPVFKSERPDYARARS